MLGLVLLEVSEAQTVGVCSKGAETTVEGDRDVGTARLTVAHHVVNLQVGIQVGLLVFDVSLNLDGGLVDEFLLVAIRCCLRREARSAQPSPRGSRGCRQAISAARNRLGRAIRGGHSRQGSRRGWSSSGRGSVERLSNKKICVQRTRVQRYEFSLN